MLPTFRLCLWLTISFAIVPIARGDSASEKTDRQIEQWVRDLDDDRFEVRDAASAKLLKAGKAAIGRLELAVGRSPEVTHRAFSLLREMTLSADEELVEQSLKCLVRLSTSKDSDIADRARKAARYREWQVATEFQKAGATVSARDGKITAISCDRAKIADLNFRLLRRLPDLVDLSLGNPDVNDDVVAQLGPLKKVEHLNLFTSKITDASLKHFKEMPSLKMIPMGQTQVTDAGLVHLKGLTQLEYVGLRGDNVTDAGLVHLKDLTNLAGLYLGETKVTDVGLVHLAKMKKMANLRLDHLAITDAGLEHLRDMKDLANLDLTETRVTEEGLSRLRKKIPMLRIAAGADR
jgi:hypothetical protein